MHLVKSYERLKFFKIQEFLHFPRFCLIFSSYIGICLDFAEMFRTLQESLLYEVPGGNQVDGLPPVASTRAGYRDVRLGRNICGVNGRLCADFS